MNLAQNGRAVVRLQYQVASLPLRLIERQTRMWGTDSRVHLLAERVVATLDAGVGQLLDDDELRRQGKRESRHADSLTRATQLEQDARSRREEADRLERQASERAAARRKEAREQQSEKVSSVVREEQADERKVAEQTREDAEKDKRSTDAKARERAESARADQRRRDEQTAARTRQITEKPKRELKIATEQRKEAGEHRGDAEVLEQLAEKEKVDRRTSS